MPDYRSYDRDPRYGGRSVRSNSDYGEPQPGISRSGSARRASGARPANSRPTGARTANSRPAGAHTASRPQGQRPSGGRQPQGRRPAPRRLKRGIQPRFFIILGIVVVLIVALILILTGGKKKPTEPQALPTPDPASGAMSNVVVSSQTPDPNAPQDESASDVPASGDSSIDESTLEQMEQEEENDDDAPTISASEQVQVSADKLMVNTSLPDTWINVLLLGTDERTLNEPARTDTMIIASINTKSGEVKLTSLMRDTAVKYEDLGKNNGTYRLNAANYFGGPLYTIKTVNELLEMNIQYYVSVNFYGFTKIAQALGGIEVDITEAEMKEINVKQRSQAAHAYLQGIDESDQENVDLTTYGPNTHLNGRQTLAYARVRYVDNDYARTERQRTVITKLTQKLRGKNVAEIGMLLSSLSGNVTTNMDLNQVLEIAMTVLNSDLSTIETLRLPENGTYTLDRRNDKEMFYDTDWKRNAMSLYNFIYA